MINSYTLGGKLLECALGQTSSVQKRARHGKMKDCGTCVELIEAHAEANRASLSDIEE